MKIVEILKDIINPNNQLFAQQIGVNRYRYKRIQLLFNRYFGKKLFYTPYGSTTSQSLYEIKHWDPSGAEIYMTEGLSDWGLERLFYLLSEKDGLFIDVGAHTGYFAHLFYEKASHFLLVETSDKCIDNALAPLVKRWHEKKVIIKHNPAYNKSGLEFNIMQSDDGWGVSKEGGSQGHASSNVKKMSTITVDEAYASNDELRGVAVSAIKIDVDGPDFEILEGCIEVVEKYRPMIFIENLGSQLFDFANNYDYDLFTFISTKENPTHLIFSHIKEVDKSVWMKMTLAVPKEKSYLLKSLDGMERSSLDRKNLFVSF